MYLRELINTFYKKYPNKLIAISLLSNFVLSMLKLTVSKKLKLKHGHFSKKVNKKVKN